MTVATGFVAGWVGRDEETESVVLVPISWSTVAGCGGGGPKQWRLFKRGVVRARGRREIVRERVREKRKPYFF